MKKFDWLVGGGLSLAALLLYGYTLAPTVLEADSGEFQFVTWLPGIAHPTGYPLYTLLGWAWTHLLPGGEVAWRMNLLSALFGAITVGVFYLVARRILETTYPEPPPAAQRMAAAAAAIIFALTPTFWGQAIIAEVYTLHTLFVAAIVGLALAGRRYPLALVFGLSLTHHITTVLLLPALILFFWYRAGKAEQSLPGGEAMRLVVVAVLPLLLYLYLPLIAPHTPYATLHLSDEQTLTLYENTWRGFIDHVTGAVFAGELQPAAVGPERLGLVWALLRQQVGGLGIVLAIAGLFGLRRRFDLLLLTGVAFLALVIFNLIYFIGDVFVLFIPVWLVVCLWLGVGVLGLAHHLADRFVQSKTNISENPSLAQIGERLSGNLYRLVVVGLVVIGVVGGGIIYLTTRNTLPNQRHNTAARDQWQTILAEPIPTDAILISNDRNEIMPLWYYQYVEKRRPDLVGLFPLIVTDPAYGNVGRVLEQALRAESRPVYLIKPMPGLGLKANLSPAGSLVRARPLSPAAPAQPLDIAINSSLTLTGYTPSASPIRPGETITITLYWQPTAAPTIDYTGYIHLLDQNNDRVAQSDHRPGGVFYPSSLWQPGETLRDQHTLSIPAYIVPGSYQLRAGLYYQPESGRLAGDGQTIGQLIINDP